MVDEEYIFKQAKRIYDDCATSQENGSAAVDGPGIADSYNDLLDRAQNEFPENEVVQSLEKVTIRGNLHDKAGAVQEVKSNTSRLADALDIDVSELTKESDGGLQPIELTVSHDVDMAQQQAQTQQQYVDVDTILEDLDRASMPPDDRDKLKEIVHEFKEELEGDRDSDRLNELLQRARERTEEYSVDVVAKLGILGLQYGITELVT